MNVIPQHRNGVLKITLSTSSVLAMATVLVLAVITTQSAQAQTFTTLRKFDSSDGSGPFAGLVQATDGNLYGTTENGGLPYGVGTVFRISPDGTFKTVYNFGAEDNTGYYPNAGLVQATNGNFFGTTSSGGTPVMNTDYGTVFKITPEGTLTTLHSFSHTDGGVPLGALIQASDGNLYGTTNEGGPNGYGTVFKITLSGTLTTLNSFNNTDGANPFGALIQASDGNLYGTTLEGGSSTNSDGTIFKITTGGTLTSLYSFCLQTHCPDGDLPYAGLVQDTNGNFYGTTDGGGSTKGSDGTVFSLSVDLGPFVETQTTSGKVGAAVKILGNDLTGATSVTFNGTAATFTVVSTSEITTEVPTGATTGFIEVATPGGTLNSNKSFTVKP